MKVGDLVKILPDGTGFYLIIDLYDGSHDDPDLGRLWQLYGSEHGAGSGDLKMHEYWMRVID